MSVLIFSGNARVKRNISGGFHTLTTYNITFFGFSGEFVTYISVFYIFITLKTFDRTDSFWGGCHSNCQVDSLLAEMQT